MAKFVFAFANSFVTGQGINVNETQSRIQLVFKSYPENVRTFILNPNFSSVNEGLLPNKSGAPEIFQFSGHGDKKHLYFHDKDKLETRRVKHKNFAKYLAGVKGLKLAIFDCCESLALAQACIKAGLPAAIGTPDKFPDATSYLMSEYFWSKIIKGYSLKSAFDQAVNLFKANVEKSSNSTNWELCFNPNYPNIQNHVWKVSPRKEESSPKSQNTMNIGKAEGNNAFINNLDINGDFNINK